MSKRLIRELSLVAGAVLFGCLLEMPVFGQEMPPEDMMPGEGQPAPAFDPNNKPVPPKEPVKPAPLEPDMTWLETRKKLEAVCSGEAVLKAQFEDIRTSHQPTDNPMVQQLREYRSEKTIVSVWQRTRPMDIDWTYPVPETTEAIEEIERRLEEQLKKEAVEKFPKLTLEEYTEEGHKKYALCKPGDQVVFNVKQGGHGVSPKQKGRLRQVTKDYIVLNPRRIFNKFDIPEETAATFFKDVHERVVKAYAEKALANCEISRANYVHYQKLKQMPERLLKANYVPNHLEYGDVFTSKIFKLEQWTSRRMLVMKQQRLLWEKDLGVRAADSNDGKKTIGERMRDEFMRRQGYVKLTPQEVVAIGQVLRQDEENRYSGWVPKADLLAAMAKLAEMEQYRKDMAAYADKLQQYKIDKQRYDQQYKEWKEAGGQETEGGEEGGEEE